MPRVCLSQLPKSTKDLVPPAKPFWLGLKLPPCKGKGDGNKTEKMAWSYRAL
jgi:hypothetical protein